MIQKFPFERVIWPTTLFLFGTLILCLTAVPAYLFLFETSWFLWSVFGFYTLATGLSITLGYHRLFSHIAFKASQPVRVFVVLFGAAAWENSILNWASDHRRHHKHVDEEDDPYSISNGFWWAHIGWLLFKLKAEPPLDNVKDLERSKLLMWQHRNIHWLALVMGFVLPAALCWAYYGTWQGALGGFLIAGVLRTVIVQHATFFINSACHYFGSQPYSTGHSARDSWIMALFTFGEGYHNYHHEFQHDYRNGVKWWQFDPTKWTIWGLAKLGLASNLRRVPEAKIVLAEIRETRRKISLTLEDASGLNLTESARLHVEQSIKRLQLLSDELGTSYYECQKAMRDRVNLSRRKLEEWRSSIEEAIVHLNRIQETRFAPRAV